jgi:D-alanyl-D-alanine carboxypeptidase/D-alanyl-D-alanine-endopeptidase (penicillin-binding protein 4)
VDGTLRNRLRGPATEGRVQAKTGTFLHANALAGYLTTRRGERLVFAVVANHHTVGGSAATGAIDDLVRFLASK